jgi:hypothetical protein
MQARTGGVVAMGMGDHDVADGFALQAGQQGLDVRRVIRPRVDDGDLAAAHHVGAGAPGGEGAGIGRHHASDQRADPGQMAVLGIELAIEGDGHGVAGRSVIKKTARRIPLCCAAKPKL